MIMYARALYRSFKVKWKSLFSYACFVYYHCAHDNVRKCVIQYVVVSKFNLPLCVKILDFIR